MLKTDLEGLSNMFILREAQSGLKIYGQLPNAFWLGKMSKQYDLIVALI